MRRRRRRRRWRLSVAWIAILDRRSTYPRSPLTHPSARARGALAVVSVCCENDRDFERDRARRVDGERARDFAGRRRRGDRGAGARTRCRSPTTAPASLRARDHRRDDQGDGPAPDQGHRGRLRDDGLRPRLHQHGLVPLGDHLHRRRGAASSSTAAIPIEQLCEKSSYLEVAYLLVFGELPTKAQLERWVFDITHHTFVHEDIKKFLEGFRYDAHPMGMLLACGRRALDLLPGREADRRPRGALHGGDPADRQDADAGRLRLPPQPRACPTSIPTTTSPTPRTSSR